MYSCNYKLFDNTFICNFITTLTFSEGVAEPAVVEFGGRGCFALKSLKE